MSPGVQTSLKKEQEVVLVSPTKQEEKRTEGKREVEKEGKKRRQDSPIVAYARIPAKAGPQGYIMRSISKSIRPDFIGSTLNTEGGNNKNVENILDTNQKNQVSVSVK